MEENLADYEFLCKSSLSDNYLRLIKTQKEKVLKELLNKMILSCEIGDKNSILNCINYYLRLNKYRNIPVEDARTIVKYLDKMLETNLTDLNLLSISLRFISKLISIYSKLTKEKFQLNWKNYYKAYEMFNILFKTNAVNLTTDKKKEYFQHLMKLNYLFCFMIKMQMEFFLLENLSIWLNQLNLLIEIWEIQLEKICLSMLNIHSQNF